MNGIGLIVRPRSTLAGLAAEPSIPRGLMAVLAAGLASLAIELGAAALAGGDQVGVVIALLLPPLFVTFWIASALLIDATAGLMGRGRRWRAYLAVSGHTFLPWVAYALLALTEVAAQNLDGGGALEAAVAWLTLPLLIWFLVLSALAVSAVYEVTPFAALALAMLPDATILTVLVILSVFTGPV